MMIIKTAKPSISKLVDFGDIPLKGFFVCNGVAYIKLQPYWCDNNSFCISSNEFKQFYIGDRVENLNESLTVDVQYTRFKDIKAEDHFIYNGTVCTRCKDGNHYFSVVNGDKEYLSPDTVVEPADIIMLVNTDKTCNRFRESMVLLNNVWNVAQHKIPLIKALRAFGENIGITFGLKEAKDWVEANLK